jgi:hypothetical protein
MGFNKKITFPNDNGACPRSTPEPSHPPAPHPPSASGTRSSLTHPQASAHATARSPGA